MRIVADADLYRVTDLFADLGELKLVPGRQITKNHLVNADALIVRSVTSVSQELLRKTPIQFVGTATSGIDHVDAEYLAEHNIKLADAKGSNANAVVDYCFAAMAELGLLDSCELKSMTIGIVGCGAVGSLFAKKLSALGLSVIVNDPPLQERANAESEAVPFRFCTLEEISRCDLISLHTPLVKKGTHPTFGLIGLEFLQSLSKRTVLLNTCRGGVVSEGDIRKFYRERNDLNFVFDVWENEPKVARDVVNTTKISTPHIAGYSMESKFAAVNSLRKSLAANFDLSIVNRELIDIDAGENHCEFKEGNSLKTILAQEFSLQQISNDFKCAVNDGQDLTYFDKVRKQLISRREYRGASMDDSTLGEFQKKILAQLEILMSKS
jgi:erythronate-4-phosphate dehydrogenase